MRRASLKRWPTEVGRKKSPTACDGRALKANLNSQSAQDNATAFKSQPQTLKSGGRKSRQKGNRAERALVRLLQDHGIAAERVPLSGSAGGSFVGDLRVPLLGADHVVEVKVRADGFRELYRWLERRDILVVRADRREPLVVVRIALATKVAGAAERAKGGCQ